MFERLENIESRYQELEAELARPETMANMDAYKKIAKEYNELKDIVEVYREWKKKGEEMEKTLAMLTTEKDDDMRVLIKEEASQLEQTRSDIESRLRDMLLKMHEENVKSMFLEIRAGAGGEEAALFARDLFGMYMKFAEKMRWKTEVMGTSLSDLGGIKEIIVLIDSRDAYNMLRYESGVHRVQRVPVTEAQGRIHTSTVTVAVLPEPEELEVDINPEELRIDVFRSSGPGGQHVNTTDSAVRITHIPTGIVVTCQDEKSQHKNKAKAIRVLRARLKEKMEMEKEQEISQERRKQVGTGDRSERIRTYNFPQGRVTDHRIGLTLYKLQNILNGDIEDILNPLIAHFQAEALKTG
ncbi:MAG TPA: peptide chain release factor 1 [Syntrophorhabdaceae bacterium]|nr:peptide chain release factor 1 [Syntrophorhabdaceae bacterium]HOL04900.1 peptide chain release factor 1 [Syntrophorhabdaceae bacterium]HON84444.1 peptide chain release factor 1 [Syntrophorhabdaceae bacterium]HOT41183.1 peptide chain release factor 1 [Syntrophorhabdaceae bacterium]HPC65754.1 peptide chain release factor 1 [Syntrophorhabdaceae bacterium]